MNTFRELLIWQRAKQLVKLIYALSEQFPDNERFGLISQMRRSAVSVPSNIAEGYGRHLSTDFVRFLRMALGSLNELETQVEICFDLNYIVEEDCKKILSETNELEKMITSFIKNLKKSNNSDF